MYNSDLLSEDYDLYDIFIEEPAIKLDNKLDLNDKYKIYYNKMINNGKKPLPKHLWLEKRERIKKIINTSAGIAGGAGLIAGGIGLHNKANSTSNLMRKRSKLEQKKRVKLARIGGPNPFDSATSYERKQIKNKYNPKIKEINYKLSKAKRKEKGKNPLIKINLSAFKNEGLIPERYEYLDYLIETYNPYDVNSFVEDYMIIYDKTFNY